MKILSLFLALIAFTSGIFGAENPPTPPVLSIVNNIQIPLIMVCGTTAKQGYLQHQFLDSTKPDSKNFQISSGLFLNATDPVICAFYKVNSLTPYPHDFVLAFSFLLVPKQIDGQNRIRGYVEQISSTDVVTTYKLDDTNGSLTVSLSSFFQPANSPIPNPSKLAPFPR